MSAHACPLAVGRYFRNVKNGPSPQWLQDRLIAIGLRPISALVDITNFVTFDLNRPLHVFDADKVTGNPDHAHGAGGREGAGAGRHDYELEPGMVVIADDEQVEAIGGIMGGELSGVTAETTQRVPGSGAVRSRAHRAHRPQARHQFRRALSLRARRRSGIRRLGHRGRHAADPRAVRRRGELRHAAPASGRNGTASSASGRSASATLGGVDVPAGRQKEILSKLGFGVEETSVKHWRVTPPSWRADVEGEADLVEEVVRLNDYDNIPVVSLPKLSALPHPAITPQQRRVPIAKRLLATRGLLEAVTFSFMPSAVAKLFQPKGANAPLVMLANPISADLDAMRPSILGNLLMAAARNAARGFADVGLFEVGPHLSRRDREGADR